MADITLNHEQKQTFRFIEVTPGHEELAEVEQYIEISPDHADRKETSTFRRARQDLLDHGYGCFIGNGCVDGPLEAHHFFVEWSKASVIDWKKMQAGATHMVNPQNGLELSVIDWVAVTLDPVTFVDRMANLMMLCAKHHRDTAHGIHHIPYSLWILQKYGIDGFEFTKAVSGR
jgi:hypothetical protein